MDELKESEAVSQFIIITYSKEKQKRVEDSKLGDSMPHFLAS